MVDIYIGPLSYYTLIYVYANGLINMVADNSFEEQLETLRRSAGIEMDCDGNWWHDGVPFEHPLIIDILNRGLSIHPETGEAVVRIGEQWCYIECQGTPFIAMNLSVSRDGMPTLLLNTSDSLTLEAVELIEQHGAVHGRESNGRLIRFSRAAQAQLADHLVEIDGDYAVSTAAGHWPIGRS